MNSIPSAFLYLPIEIMEDVLVHVDLHQDLVSLALVSHTLKGTVIPKHTEYRTIRIRHLLPHLWAHLARRSDLARNVREVHLCERHDYTAPDRYPTSLIDKNIDERLENVTEEAMMNNLAVALGHMKHLRTFTWHYHWNAQWKIYSNPRLETLVLRSLTKVMALRQVALLGNFGSCVTAGKSPDGSDYPVLEISNLQSLSILTNACASKSDPPYVCHMLERSPDLEFLEMPMEFKQLAEYNFPRLKTLKLPLLSGAIKSIDQSRAIFIDNHPTIEELSWFPIGPVKISANIIPAIKRLRTGRQVLEALEEMNVVRQFEYLDIASITSYSLAKLNCVDRTSLRMLKLHSLGSLESMHHLAEIFPNISWLALPHTYMPADALHPRLVDLDGWLDILSHFQNLEVFRGAGIWAAVNQKKEVMHHAILELVQRCPKLRQLDHCDYYSKRQDWKRIIILREGIEGERVRYEVRKPPPLRLFDGVGEKFD